MKAAPRTIELGGGFESKHRLVGNFFLDRASLAESRVDIKKKKLYGLYGTELESIFKIKEYLKNSELKVTVSLDREGNKLVGEGRCLPFRKANYELEHQAKGIKSQSLGHQDTPIFCRYPSRPGNFVISAKAGLTRDERLVEIDQYRNTFEKVSDNVYLAHSAYVLDDLLTNPLPEGFIDSDCTMDRQETRFSVILQADIPVSHKQDIG